MADKRHNMQLFEDEKDAEGYNDDAKKEEPVKPRQLRSSSVSD